MLLESNNCQKSQQSITAALTCQCFSARVIVCGNDLLAYATFDYCRDQGFRVPEDFAIVGFDGIVSQVRPAAVLTTIRAPWSDVAQTALDLVIRRLTGEAVPPETVLPVALVVGETA